MRVLKNHLIREFAIAGVILIIVIILASKLSAQTPGTVVALTKTTITGTAGTGASQVICSFDNGSNPQVHVVCQVGGTTYLTQDNTVVIGGANGWSGTFSFSSNSVSWQIQQLTAGTVNYQIAANGTTKTGTF